MSVTQNTHDRSRDRSRGALGLGMALFSAATFSTSGTFADSLMRTGWSPGAVVTFRIAIAAVLLTVPGVLSLRGRWHQLRQAAPAALAFGLIAVAGCQLFFFNAVEHLDVGVALLLEYLGIFLVVVWLWLRRGQRPRRLTVGGGAAALAGLVLVLNPGTGGIDAVGVLWGLLAACGLAVYFVLASRVDEALPPIALAWLGMIVGAVALIVCDSAHLLAFHVHTHDVQLFHRSTSWIVPVVGLSLVAAAVAYASGILATRLLGAKLASFVGLTEVLFAVLIAWLVLGQRPGLGQLLGGLVVLAGIALVRVDELRADAQPAPEPMLAEPAR